MRNLAESSESFRRVIFFPFKFLPRPHVTREKAGKLPNNFQTLFFLFTIWGKFQQSVAFLLHWLRFKAIDGHFANSLRYLLRFCNSLWYLLRFMAIFQQLEVFLIILLFTAFPPVTWGLIADKKNEKIIIFSPCFKHPPPPGQAEKMSLSLFSDVEDHLEYTISIKMSKNTPPPPPA